MECCNELNSEMFPRALLSRPILRSRFTKKTEACKVERQTPHKTHLHRGSVARG